MWGRRPSDLPIAVINVILKTVSLVVPSVIAYMKWVTPISYNNRFTVIIKTYLCYNMTPDLDYYYSTVQWTKAEARHLSKIRK